jgi:flagellar hook-associated protein 2
MVGTDAPYEVRSSTNTFSGLLPDTSVTVSEKTSGPVTVSVSSDPDAVTAKVSALIAAANGALSTINAYTDAGKDTATLKGDSSLRSLAGQILDAVSHAVGSLGSPAGVGVQLNRDGTILFTPETFTAALKANPALAQGLLAGTGAGPGADGVVGGGDDTPPVPGVATRLLDLAKAASNSATGTLTLLAKSQDAQADDLKGRIADWDLRLALRQKTLSRQFTAMETALGTLQNQSTWLSGQLSALPSWSKSAKS